MKLTLNKIKLKKPNLSKVSLSKIHFRKFNKTTALALLSYLNIFALIVYMFSKNKPFLRFHAKQGIILLAFFAVTVFTFYFAVFPWLFTLFYVLCVIWGLVNVALGRERQLPLIGKLANSL